MATAEHKKFTDPDEVRTFERTRAEILQVGGGSVGRMTLQPGWRWSVDMGPTVGTGLCQAPHFQYSISGTLRVRMADGTEFDVGPGEVSVVPPGHDAWVVGDEPVVAIDWGGAHDWGRPA